MTPNARLYRPEPEYIADLVEKAKKRLGATKQAVVAARIGVGLSTLKNWKAGTVRHSYTDQYTLECLAGLAGRQPDER